MPQGFSMFDILETLIDCLIRFPSFINKKPLKEVVIRFIEFLSLSFKETNRDLQDFRSTIIGLIEFPSFPNPLFPKFIEQSTIIKESINEKVIVGDVIRMHPISLEQFSQIFRLEKFVDDKKLVTDLLKILVTELERKVIARCGINDGIGDELLMSCAIFSYVCNIICENFWPYQSFKIIPTNVDFWGATLILVKSLYADFVSSREIVGILKIIGFSRSEIADILKLEKIFLQNLSFIPKPYGEKNFEPLTIKPFQSVVQNKASGKIELLLLCLQRIQTLQDSISATLSVIITDALPEMDSFLFAKIMETLSVEQSIALLQWIMLNNPGYLRNIRFEIYDCALVFSQLSLADIIFLVTTKMEGYFYKNDLLSALIIIYWEHLKQHELFPGVLVECCFYFLSLSRIICTVPLKIWGNCERLLSVYYSLLSKIDSLFNLLQTEQFLWLTHDLKGEIMRLYPNDGPKLQLIERYIRFCQKDDDELLLLRHCSKLITMVGTLKLVSAVVEENCFKIGVSLFRKQYYEKATEFFVLLHALNPDNKMVLHNLFISKFRSVERRPVSLTKENINFLLDLVDKFPAKYAQSKIIGDCCFRLYELDNRKDKRFLIEALKFGIGLENFWGTSSFFKQSKHFIVTSEEESVSTSKSDYELAKIFR